LTNRTLKTPNGQLNRNAKFDVFGHLKRNGGSNILASLTNIFTLHYLSNKNTHVILINCLWSKN
jgi:hypothetical protein